MRTGPSAPNRKTSSAIRPPPPTGASAPDRSRSKTRTIATETAKKLPATGGVVHWDQAPDGYWDRLMAALPVTEVWGIAGRLAKRLEAMGIETIADLRDADPVAIRHTFSVVQMRTELELNGFPAIPVEDEVATKAQILVSRSFPDPIWNRRSSGPR